VIDEVLPEIKRRRQTLIGVHGNIIKAETHAFVFDLFGARYTDVLAAALVFALTL
jgi:hypothetical protein